MILIKQKSDILGAAVSSLCILHCFATPLLFVIQSNSSDYFNVTPIWWPFIDYFLLIVSFVAMYRSTQTTSLKWMKPLLWISWFGLLIVIINEKTEWLSSMNAINYIPALILIMLHLYNKKHCQCNKNECCINEK